MIAAKNEKLKQSNIYFSTLFGGGAKYSSGEDSLFLAECLRKGLRIYKCPLVIGYVAQEDSSWFKGYTDKYFKDKGIFFFCLSKRWAKLFCLQFAIRHKNTYKQEKSMKEAISLMFEGINSIK